MSATTVENTVIEESKVKFNPSPTEEVDLSSDAILKRPPPENLTLGRAKLRKWLSRSFRVVITDGRILIGIFNCTDKDANIVLAMCAEYLEEGGDARLLGNVMIPGKHIVSIEVDLLGQNQETT